jgi:hypothetical protein
VKAVELFLQFLANAFQRLLLCILPIRG